MAGKISIAVSLLLAILLGALGVYSYTLNQDINALSQRLASANDEFAAFRQQSTARSDSLEKERDAATARIGTLQEEINGTQGRVSALIGEIDDTQTELNDLEGELGGTLIRLDTLDKGFEQVAARVSESVVSADGVYQGVSQAVVRISDGDRVIGSGFLIDAQYHVATAFHVIERLPRIDVIFPDGSFSSATVIGSSKHSDIAILDLKKPPAVKPLALADSAALRIGEPVLAIGDPFDLMGTLTAGIISQTDRAAEIQYSDGIRSVANLIQFDAAVNFGNSGGPLFNSKEEVVGMVIARVSPLEGDGVYYAVSSNKLRRVAASLIDRGSYDYPWLGISIADITPQIAQSRGLDSVNGVLVRQVAAGDPAIAAGVKADDIIVTFDGIMVRNVAKLISYLGENKSPGNLVTLKIIRNSLEMELSLEIGKSPL
ncbi:MAG: trypsin-like peptidase domain-containing protein [Chloroflexi bacterium]|nr:trypsin-like peptidase domain-containing protein [Chloroflexota bacterium]